MSKRESLVAQLESLMLEKKLKKAEVDFYLFLIEFVKTQDEHDSESPIKRIPKKEYIKELAHKFQTEDKLLIEKSRQMMVTWISCAYALWFTMFNEGKRTFMQSKKEADANANLDRIKLIYRYLPDEIKEKYPADNPMPYCKLTWKKRNSSIQAIPQGPDILRQYTSSLIISDEMAFQEKSEEAYMSAKPTLSGGGRFIGISSPNFKEFFYRGVSDTI